MSPITFQGMLKKPLSVFAVQQTNKTANVPLNTTTRVKSRPLFIPQFKRKGEVESSPLKGAAFEDLDYVLKSIKDILISNEI